ncbi:MAG: calcium/sodium antiporter [Candidatus Delongbacteria bacterium]|nr:calcium/sodium antiporter [Candidatus Delongbacteria bacterium]
MDSIINAAGSVVNSGNPIILTVLLVLGLFILIKGGDLLINGAEAVSISYNIDPFVIGLTVVAFGTSLPEFFVSFIANINDSPGIGLGNVVGSNIANIALVLGIAATITVITVKKETLFKDLPIIFIITVIFYVLMLDGEITRSDGIFLTILFVGYLAYIWIDAKRKKKNLLDDEIPDILNRKKNILLIFFGITGLYLGSEWTIRGASGLAKLMGVSELAIGLTIVAVGTSLPELVATLQAVRKGNHNIGVGNIIGSNAFNLLFVIGINSMIKPFPVDDSSIVIWGPVMLFITAILFIFSFRKFSLSRFSGILLLAMYVVYAVFSFIIK